MDVEGGIPLVRGHLFAMRDLKTFQTTPTVSSDGQMTSDEANLCIVYNMIYNSDV